jgi:hypothetical protein
MMIRSIIIALSISVLGTLKAFAVDSTEKQSPAITTINCIASFKWRGVQWDIPKELLPYFPISLTKQNEIDINAGYLQFNQHLVPFYQAHDTALEIRVVSDDSEDPKNGFMSMQRTGPSLARNPILTSAKLDGITYLGSRSVIHFFQLTDQSAYVDCNLNVTELRVSGGLTPNVTEKMFYCTTSFALPHGLFVWVRSPNIRLNDISTVFSATHRIILSYMH